MDGVDCVPDFYKTSVTSSWKEKGFTVTTNFWIAEQILMASKVHAKRL